MGLEAKPYPQAGMHFLPLLKRGKEIDAQHFEDVLYT
jgi:hypothetical protein